MTQHINESEVARIRAAIAEEHIAASQGLSGFAAGNARHEFITARQQRIGEHFETLASMMPKEQAIALVAETLQNIDVAKGGGGSDATH